MIIGWLCVSLLWELQPLREPDAARGIRAAHALAADPGEWNARELRLLPGIGERRALDTVRARREHTASGLADEPLLWEDVPGIGERTGAAARAYLRARGARTVEAWSPR